MNLRHTLLLSALLLVLPSTAPAQDSQVESVRCWKEDRAQASNQSTGMLRRFRAEVVGTFSLSSCAISWEGQAEVPMTAGIRNGKRLFFRDSGFLQPGSVDATYPASTYTFRAAAGIPPDEYFQATLPGGTPPFPTIASPAPNSTVSQNPITVSWTIPDDGTRPTGFIITARNVITGAEFTEEVQNPGATSRQLPVDFLDEGETGQISITSFLSQSGGPKSAGDRRVTNFVVVTLSGPTPTFTRTFTPTVTPTFTPTPTATDTPTATATFTETATPTVTDTPTETPLGPSHTPTETPVYLRADADRNGVVDRNDMLILLQEWKNEGVPAPVD